MKMLSLCEERSTEIAMAVKEVYRQAGFDPEVPKPGVVPLYELIGAYPLRIAPLKNLTYQGAIKFLAAETGQVIASTGCEDRKISGFLYVYEFAGLFYGCILVEKDEPIARQRFSAAHELGHYLLHFLPVLERSDWHTRSKTLMLAEGPTLTEGDAERDTSLVELSYASDSQAKTYKPPIDPQKMELEADQFAAEILMPATVCQVLAQRHCCRRSGIQRQALAGRLAPEFLVSQTAMKLRLERLNLPESLKNPGAESPGEQEA